MAITTELHVYVNIIIFPYSCTYKFIMVYAEAAYFSESQSFGKGLMIDNKITACYTLYYTLGDSKIIIEKTVSNSSIYTSL